MEPSVTIKEEGIVPVLTKIATDLLESQRNFLEKLQAGGMTARTARAFEEVLKCFMCDGPHAINKCPKVEEYMQAGKCYRNQLGKVVLPTGAMPSRNLPGRNLAEKIDEWHRQHPNQLDAKIAPTLIHTIDHQLVPLRTSQSQCQSPSYTLSHDERLATMEAEVFNLRRAKEVAAAAVRTRAQRTQEQDHIREGQEIAAARQQILRIEEVEDVDAAPKQPTVNASTSQPIAPEHPFRNAKDATYMPPVNRNVAAKEKQPYAKRPEPAFKTLPPIHDPAIATKVYQRYMDTEVKLTNRELLSLSPEIRSQVRDNTTTRRLPFREGNTAQNYFDQDNTDYELDNMFNTITDQQPMISTLATQHAHYRTPPEGAIIIPDKYEAYYKSLPHGELPDPTLLMVADESASVRAISATIDHSQKTECILDPGCQIIAMSESTCNSLGIAYDPAIILNMESANGNINPSLGLARNVPFQIAKLTFYLQVHIVHSPAYDVLLGRPFDVLTESVVRNFANEDQTITIRDPNTGERITVPTLPRARKHRPCPHIKKQDF
jgi:hypothetical protein